MTYSPAQIKQAKKGIQKSLTGCYPEEYRLGLLIGTNEHKIALAMAAENNSQILAGRVDGKYQYFAPKFKTMPGNGFKWNK